MTCSFIGVSNLRSEFDLRYLRHGRGDLGDYDVHRMKVPIVGSLERFPKSWTSTPREQWWIWMVGEVIGSNWSEIGLTQDPIGWIFSVIRIGERSLLIFINSQMIKDKLFIYWITREGIKVKLKYLRTNLVKYLWNWERTKTNPIPNNKGNWDAYFYLGRSARCSSRAPRNCPLLTQRWSELRCVLLAEQRLPCRQLSLVPLLQLFILAEW